MDIWSKSGSTSEKITIEEVAEFLECSEERVQDMLREGRLPGFKPGKAWVIPRVAFFDAVNVAAVQAQAVRLDSARGPQATAPVQQVLPKRRGRPRFPRTLP